MVSTSTPGFAHENESGVWAVITLNDNFQTADGPSRWRYWFDAQYREYNLPGGVTQTVLRPAVGYDLGPTVSAWAGYARITTRDNAGNEIDENRYWQQIAWTANRTQRGLLIMRARLEQRDLEVGDDLGWALRYQLRYSHRAAVDSPWQVFGYVEPFFALRDTDWGADTGLQQNRTSLGVSYAFSHKAVLEVAYMHQYIPRDAGEDLSNHNLTFNLKLKI